MNSEDDYVKMKEDMIIYFFVKVFIFLNI